MTRPTDDRLTCDLADSIFHLLPDGVPVRTFFVILNEIVGRLRAYGMSDAQIADALTGTDPTDEVENER